MKNIIIFCLIIFFSAFFTSCEDMLKEDQKGVYTEDNFYDSKDNAISALLYAYAPQKLTEYAERFQFNLMDLPTDECSTYGKGVETLFYTWDVSPITEEFTYFYKYIYMSINRANSVIENVSKMSSKIISKEDRDQIVGEAYFLRAFNHFMAVRTFGEVPIHISQINSQEDGQVAFSPIEDIYAQIIEDLEQAISMMGIHHIQGRADLVAAQSVLAKVYLTLASSKDTGSPGYEWVSDAQAMYDKAAEYSEKVVFGQNTYALEPDLSKVYNVDYEDSPEHIWITERSRVYDRINLPMMFSNSIDTKYIPKKLGEEVHGPEDVELYIAEGQGGWNYYRPDSNFYSSYDNQDLRKGLLLTKIYDKNGQVIVEWAPENINSSEADKAAFYYPMCRKYTDPYADGINTSVELYFFRFSEVMLTYAEAAGPTVKGYEAVNAVRSRAGLPDLPEGLSIGEFREAVWNELKFELAFEGKRLLELRRTNRVKDAITKPGVSEAKLNEYAYFYPIPQRELDLNSNK
jgi:hypothetical protein